MVDPHLDTPLQPFPSDVAGQGYRRSPVQPGGSDPRGQVRRPGPDGGNADAGNARQMSHKRRP